MDSFEMLLLAAGAAVIALVTTIVLFRPFDRIRRSDNRDWAWIGGDHRSDGDCAHGGSDGAGGGD